MEEGQKRKKANPYTYDRPLEPSKDSQVIISREKEVYGVVGKLMQGKYCAVLGPRGIGKSTFLHQVKSEFETTDTICLYLNLENLPEDEAEFYRHLKDIILTNLPNQVVSKTEAWNVKQHPTLTFYNFLINLRPTDTNKRIVLLFDHLRKLTFLHSFLKFWRRIFHERFHSRGLYQNIVGIAVDFDLIAQTIGPNSPFNIAEKLYLKDFSQKESRRLIVGPLFQLKIDIQPDAIAKLIETLSGHPQMLQQACNWLVENALKKGCGVTAEDVDNAIDILTSTNSIIKAFIEELRNNAYFRRLVDEILGGQKKKFHPYKEYAYMGTGAIKEDEYYCAVRNRVFETVFNRSGT